MKNETKIKRTSASPLIIGLAFSVALMSCTSNYSVNTNLDANNFENYFSIAKVEEFTSENEFISPFKNLGIIEGQDCQEKAHHAEPEELRAKNKLKRNAYKAGANAVIFTGCALMNNEADKKCHSELICYARAFQIDNSKSDQ